MYKVAIIEDYCFADSKTSATRKTTAEFIKKILVYTYHPLWNYGVTSDNLKKKKD